VESSNLVHMLHISSVTFCTILSQKVKVTMPHTDHAQMNHNLRTVGHCVFIHSGDVVATMYRRVQTSKVKVIRSYYAETYNVP